MINISKKVKPTKAEREAIVEWLMIPMDGAKHRCPFRVFSVCDHTNIKLCASWFPMGLCPCSCYPRKTVVKYANMMLRAK